MVAWLETTAAQCLNLQLRSSYTTTVVVCNRICPASHAGHGPYLGPTIACGDPGQYWQRQYKMHRMTFHTLTSCSCPCVDNRCHGASCAARFHDYGKRYILIHLLYIKGPPSRRWRAASGNSEGHSESRTRQSS